MLHFSLIDIIAFDNITVIFIFQWWTTIVFLLIKFQQLLLKQLFSYLDKSAFGQLIDIIFIQITEILTDIIT